MLWLLTYCFFFHSDLDSEMHSILVKRWKKNRDMDPVVTSGANYTHMHVVVKTCASTYQEFPIKLLNERKLIFVFRNRMTLREGGCTWDPLEARCGVILYQQTRNISIWAFTGCGLDSNLARRSLLSTEPQTTTSCKPYQVVADLND